MTFPVDFPDRLAPESASNLFQKKGARLWPKSTEAIGLEFELEAIGSGTLDANYARGLHAWFLAQIQEINRDLSARMHDSAQEKGFTVSRLRGDFVPADRGYWVPEKGVFYWSVSGLNREVVEALHQLVRSKPRVLDQRVVQFNILACRVELEGTTYRNLLKGDLVNQVSLSFVTATGFRRKGKHLPLPMPFNVFQSYLRRWEAFAGNAIEKEDFLKWIDEEVVVRQHQIESCLVPVKKGSFEQAFVTGFVGCVTFAVARKGLDRTDFVRLFGGLGRYASYCGTGHKTAFGLGQTRWGWLMVEEERKFRDPGEVLAERIALLRGLFYSQKKRRGGERASRTAEVWATILARREFGESLVDIAEDLGMKKETVKTYVKLARRALKEELK